MQLIILETGKNTSKQTTYLSNTCKGWVIVQFYRELPSIFLNTSQDRKSASNLICAPPPHSMTMVSFSGLKEPLLKLLHLA